MLKRCFLLTCLLMAVMLDAKAGTPVAFGVKAGFELTELNFNSNALRQENRVGFYVGPSIEFPLHLSGLSMDISGLYSKRNLKVDNEKVPQKCILLPANLRFGVEVGKVALVFASAGPQFAFNIGDDIYQWQGEDQRNRQYMMQNTLLSFNFGIGVRLEHHLEAAVYYNIPVGKAADFTWDKLTDELKNTTWETAKTKTNAWHVSVSYYF